MPPRPARTTVNSSSSPTFRTSVHRRHRASKLRLPRLLINNHTPMPMPDIIKRRPHKRLLGQRFKTSSALNSKLNIILLFPIPSKSLLLHSLTRFLRVRHIHILKVRRRQWEYRNRHPGHMVKPNNLHRWLRLRFILHILVRLRLRSAHRLFNPRNGANSSSSKFTQQNTV